MGMQRDPSFLSKLAKSFLTPRNVQVLIVDPDEQGSRALAAALAAALGHRYVVTFAPTLAAARQAIERRQIAVVVTELDLPDATGLTLLSLLRSQPATKHVLLMTLTRRTAVSDKIAAFRSGSDDYIVKPIAPNQFAEHVQRLSRFQQVVPSLAL